MFNFWIQPRQPPPMCLLVTDRQKQLKHVPGRRASASPRSRSDTHKCPQRTDAPSAFICIIEVVRLGGADAYLFHKHSERARRGFPSWQSVNTSPTTITTVCSDWEEFRKWKQINVTQGLKNLQNHRSSFSFWYSVWVTLLSKSFFPIQSNN